MRSLVGHHWSRPSIKRLGLVVILAAGVVLAGSADAANMTNHGGVTLKTPKIFVTYWGQDWANGFLIPPLNFTSAQYQAYLEAYITQIGGHAWLGSQTQYGAGNPANILGGTWVDTGNEPVPATPNYTGIGVEVSRSAYHFHNGQPPADAIYLIALPPGHGDSMFVTKGGNACAWHQKSTVAFTQNRVAFITLPPLLDAYPGCGAFNVNKTADQFGHGFFDGVAIAVGHEYAEVITDPYLNAWYDGGETGDKCAWQNLLNVGGSGWYFAVQPLWSNAFNACTWGGAPLAQTSPGGGLLQFGSIDQYQTTQAQTLKVTNTGTIDLLFNKDAFTGTPWTLGGDYKDFLVSNNTCDKVLHPLASCQADMQFRPTDIGQRNGSVGLSVQFGQQQPFFTSLSGTGLSPWAIVNGLPPAQPKIPVGHSAPINLNFVPQPANPLPPPRTIVSVGVGGRDASDFEVTDDGCTGQTLQGGSTDPAQAQCGLGLLATPSKTGPRVADLVITDSTGVVTRASLVITGDGPIAQLNTGPSAPVLLGDGTPGTLPGTFFAGEGMLGQTLTRQITLTNAGAVLPLQVGTMAVEGDFALGNNSCAGATLAPPAPPVTGGSCTFDLLLTPRHLQDQRGTLTITSNANEDVVVDLTGDAQALFAALSPEPLPPFGPTPPGSSSPPQSVQLTNVEGDASLHVLSVSASGDFVATSHCPEFVYGDCGIDVTFRPTASGERTGELVVVTNSINSPLRLPLRGGVTGGTAGGNGGAFVVGDLSAAAGSKVTFWGAQWARNNALSGGPAPAAFKGFANGATPACGGTWAASPGGSGNPPATLPPLIEVVVTSGAQKSGPNIGGRIDRVVIVQTDPGYAADPERSGTGTIVGTLCP